ncbi:MAG: hypothetical protein V1831_00880 [Candidatus Woesearchaeota archaeon]
MTTLGQIASNMDSARLAGKAIKIDPFLSKTTIEGPENRIQVPEGAIVMRTKSGEVRFYRFNPNIANGYTPIPERTKEVQFQNYSGNSRYIDYGEPTFY